MNFYYKLDTILIGFFFQFILNCFGILTGDEAINYYGEVHQSNWNSNIHSIFMPITSFGFLLGIPSLFRLNRYDAHIFQDCVYLFYTVHYSTISLKIGMVFALVYYQVLIKAKNNYRNNFSYAFYGLATSTVTLIIQEVVGHQMGGDNPSRLDGIFNAVMYANFYSLKNIVG